jgi:predicted nucleic acid-binding protein
MSFVRNAVAPALTAVASCMASGVRRLVAFFEAVDRGRIRVATSVVTLTEVLVRPLREGRRDLVLRYGEILLSSGNFDTIPVSAEIAEHAAQIRATRGLRV